MKFVRFIEMISELAAFRKWKEVVRGVGADPRYALMLMQERDLVRRRFFKPQIERRKNLKTVRHEL